MCSSFCLLPLAVFVHNYSECAAAFVSCLSLFSCFRCPDCTWFNLPFDRLTKLAIAVISNKVICKEYASGWLLIDMVLCQ